MTSEFQTTHCVIHLAIDAPDAKTLPVLVELDDPNCPAINRSVATFARYIQKQGVYSYTWLWKAVNTIGQLRDFYALEKQKKVLGPGDFRPLLEDFLFALDHGTVLGWRPASNAKYRSAKSALSLYMKFLRGDADNIVSDKEAEFIAACLDSAESTKHAEKSLLAHTKPREKKKVSGRRKNVVGLRRYKPFPPWLVHELISETKNQRDKLIFALIAYGGRRSSELLHLFLEDVGLEGKEALVYLKHPALSPMKWKNNAHRTILGQRREYLRAMFGLLPRTDYGGLPAKVGWKGIKFDDEIAKSSQMYWIRDAGAYILLLHRNYLHTFRASTPRRHHPYYFVDESGEPLKMQALEKQFSLACGRLERKHGIRLDGYGLHSLRHFYGFYCADVLGLDLLLIQKYMGHSQLSSTSVYAHISPETAARALQDAEKKARGEDVPTPEERADITNQFRNMTYVDLRDVMARGTSSFGHVDTNKLSRKIR